MSDGLVKVKREPGVLDLIIARLPEAPLDVMLEIVCVVPDVNIRPFGRPALFTARVPLNVLLPVIVMLSPEKVTLLYVIPPPPNVLAVDPLLEITIVEPVVVRVKPAAVTPHGKPDDLVSVSRLPVKFNTLVAFAPVLSERPVKENPFRLRVPLL